MQTRYKMIGAGALAVVFAAAALTDGNDQDGDLPSPHLTPVEAVCEMLADGDTAEEAYDVLLELDMAPAVASRAVGQATSGDC
jgi:hypothetical protein